jgi:hypothetical protein
MEVDPPKLDTRWQVEELDVEDYGIVEQARLSLRCQPLGTEGEEESDDASEGSGADGSSDSREVLFDFEWGSPKDDGVRAREEEDAHVSVDGHPLVESSSEEDPSDVGWEHECDGQDGESQIVLELQAKLQKSYNNNKRLSEMLVDARDELVRYVLCLSPRRTCTPLPWRLDQHHSTH